MPFLRLEVPNDNNSMLSAAVLNLLLPVFNDADEEQFDTLFHLLFGTVKLKISAQFMQELGAYTPSAFPASLYNLINTQLRPKLAAYISAHQSQYLTSFSSEEALQQQINDISHASTPCDALAIKALSDMMHVLIRIVKSTDALPQETAGLVLQDASLSPPHIIYLWRTGTGYQALIKPEQLNPKLCAQFTSSTTAQVPSSGTLPGDATTFFRRAAFEHMLGSVLGEIPRQLKKLSVGAPPKPAHVDPFALISPSQIPQLTPRYEVFAEEIPAISMRLSKANPDQKKGTNLRQSRENTALGTSRLPETAPFEYFLLLCESSWGDLFNPTDAPVAGHAFALLTLMCTLGIPAVGTIYATEYEQAIKSAKQLLHEKNYAQAAEVLDTEFQRWSIPRTLRAMFLTKEHYAIAHFFRAICADKKDQIPQAYDEYEIACRDAIEAGNEAAIFLIKLQQIKLLKKYTKDQLGGRVADPIAELNKTLVDLTVNFQPGFADLYWKIQDKIIGASYKFLSKEKLSSPLIAAANRFLTVESLFFLRYFAEGRGQFLAIFSVFFQGVMLAYFHHENKAYLQADTQYKLVTELCKGESPTVEPALILASKKFFQCAEMLHDFKEQPPAPFYANKARARGISFITNFIIDFHAHYADAFQDNKSTYYKMAKSLSIKTTDAALLLENKASAIALLVTLNVEFGLIFPSVDAWFDAIEGKELAVMSVAPGPIDVSKMSKEKPTLIKQDKKYFIHGNTQGEAWGLTPLDSGAVTKAKPLFPAVAIKGATLAYDPKNNSIYEDIKIKNAHAGSLAPIPGLQHLVSKTTGDTMLHVLAHYATTNAVPNPRIRGAAKQLEELRYIRNNKHEIPNIVLQSHSGQNTAYNHASSELIKIGDELDKVVAFLEKIKENPSIDGHFMLLDGPPGTGKTSSVLKQLGSLGYPVRPWVRGAKDDQFHNRQIQRTLEFFETSKSKATPNTVQVMFIDEIHGVIPIVEGMAINGYYNSEADVAAFLEAITAMNGYRVAIIGATNYPAQLPEPLLSRAGINRIYFPLPNREQRHKLLQHFFRNKTIDPSDIDTLATLAVGYSPRELISFVESIQESIVTFDTMANYFNRYANTLRKAFKSKFKCAEIFMPSFENEGQLSDLFSMNSELQEQLVRLQREVSADPEKHTLLYGPPGGGKTSAIRIFAQTSGRVLIAVQAGKTTNINVLRDIFERAKQLGRAIIFFDEMHEIAYAGSQHAAFLQTEMDGIIANDITVIGATNYPDSFEPALLNRFTTKILLPQLDKAALNKPIKKLLLDCVTKYDAEVYFDAPLAAEMEDGATELGHVANGLGLRAIKAALGYLMGDLSRARHGAAGITYLRLQDVCFSIYIKKIQENIIPKPIDKTPTYTQYIQEHTLSFFPAAIPEGSIQVPKIACSLK